MGAGLYPQKMQVHGKQVYGGEGLNIEVEIFVCVIMFRVFFSDGVEFIKGFDF